MSFHTILKDPDGELDYKFDLKPKTNGSDDPSATDWLTTNETVSTHTMTCPTGITIDSSSITDTNTSVTVWLSGGAAGTDYDVTCHWVTSASRADDRTITISVVER